MFNMYDEANIDLEEMMYLHDVENENDTEDISNENEDDISNEVEDDYVLTQSFLDRQSKLLDNEKIKMKVFHKPSEKIFKGIVLGKCQGFTDKYVFSMYEVIDGKEVEPLKTKIFNLKDLIKEK